VVLVNGDLNWPTSVASSSLVTDVCAYSGIQLSIISQINGRL